MKYILASILRAIRAVTPEPTAPAVRFRIVHRFRRAGSVCLPGEEITAIYLISRNREMLLPLPLALRFLFDYLAKHRHLPQSATQIASGIRSSEFYRKHGMNAGLPSRRKISRSAVKEYVKRIRQAVEVTIPEAQPGEIGARLLTSVKTVGNEVQYRLFAPVEWVHTEELSC